MKPTFEVILPFDNLDILLKDPGRIPFYLSQMGYDCTFTSFISKEKVDSKAELQQFRESVKIVELLDDRRSTDGIDMRSLSIIRYIWDKAKKIEILNLYFLKHSMLYALIYKIRNPKGILYVKLDMNYQGFEQNEKQLIEPLRRLIYRNYLQYIPDIVSAETNPSLNYVRRRYLPHSEKLALIPDGIDDRFIERNQIAVSPWDRRENIFLTVGRIGTPPKNNAMMLSAASLIQDWRDWKFYIIGPIQPDFQFQIDEFYCAYPSLKEKVIFVGAIEDRIELMKYYNRAKVFCLTSKYESFGLVYAEAQYFGNYILSTPVSSIDDFIENDKGLGLVFNTAEEMGRAMQDIIDGKNPIDVAFEKRTKHGEHFRWSFICNQLDEQFQKFKV